MPVRVRALVLPFIAVALCCAASKPVHRTITVSSQVQWTSTDLEVSEGDTVTVTASGTMKFGLPPIDHLGPDGVAWGSACLSVDPQDRANWSAIGLRCWALLARVGYDGVPVVIGKQRTFKVTNEGQLFLGINDNFLLDNAGKFTAQVSVQPWQPPAESQAVSAQASAPLSSKSSSSFPVLPVVAGVLGLGGLVALLVRWWRSRFISFELPSGLRAATVDVAIADDGSIARLVDGQSAPLIFVEEDFADVSVTRAIDSVVVRGIELRMVRGHGFSPPHGEAVQHGQCVAGSGGLLPTRDGYTTGLVAPTFAGEWIFTLRSVDPLQGRLTVFALADEPFDAQLKTVFGSLPQLHTVLPTLIERQPRSGLLQTRIR
ncbi:MAG TPA: hypothetical protein VFR41_07940 [Acidimicrobiia bacterium]|nr:hypothetical protein [Acidimicrobiia bacterium]